MAFKNDVADDMAPVGQSVWPRWAPRLAPHWAPHLAPAPRPAPRPAAVMSKKRKKKIFFFFFWLLLLAGKEGKKYFNFRFSIPKIPKFPELRGRSREKKKVFSA
jgi:hypothetical protein